VDGLAHTDRIMSYPVVIRIAKGRVNINGHRQPITGAQREDW